MSSITISQVPTGGAFSLGILASGATMTLARGVSGVAGFTTIYSGPPTPLFIDVGDGQPAPLASGTYINYQLTDANGTLTTPYVLPSMLLNIQEEPILPLLQRLYTAGLGNIALPNGVNPVTVLQAMPIAGLPNMPFVVINNDLTQQTQIPIGQNFENVDDDTGIWTITGFCHRIFRISILANNAVDRNFYQDAIIAIFESILKTVLTPLGINVHHKYQASAGQVAKDPQGMGPGFYYADVMCEFDGTFNISINPVYGLINTITVTPQYGDGVSDTFVVPNSG